MEEGVSVVKGGEGVHGTKPTSRKLDLKPNGVRMWLTILNALRGTGDVFVFSRYPSQVNPGMSAQSTKFQNGSFQS